MRVLLTGATGFIGSRVARKLVASGHDVTALIRSVSSMRRISDVLNSMTLVNCDLLSPADLERRLEVVRPEICVHLAWYTEPGKYVESLNNISYLSASIQLAMKLASKDCRRFVGVGTCYEYDAHKISRCLSEGDNTAPASSYAASKLGLYLALRELGKATGMEIAWTRLFYQYGPYEDERRLVPYVVRSLLTNSEVRVTRGEQIRDYLYVDDVAAAICAVAESNITGAVNVGSGRAIMVKELVTLIGKLLGRERLIKFGSLPYNPAEPMFLCANNKLITKKTSWSPQYDLRKGMMSTINWWQSEINTPTHVAKGGGLVDAHNKRSIGHEVSGRG